MTPPHSFCLSHKHMHTCMYTVCHPSTWKAKARGLQYYDHLNFVEQDQFQTIVNRAAV